MQTLTTRILLSIAMDGSGENCPADAVNIVEMMKVLKCEKHAVTVGILV
jgi:hypothetical protein